MRIGLPSFGLYARLFVEAIDRLRHYISHHASNAPAAPTDATTQIA